MLAAKLTWHRKTETRVLKSGYAFTGPAGSALVIQHIASDVIPKGMVAGAYRLSSAMEKHAKQHHKWQNRTGAAEASLYGYAVPRRDGAQAGLAYHKDQAHYVFWLENRWNGRYAIIGPTQQLFAGKAAAIMAQEVNYATAGKGSKFKSTKTGRFT